MEYGDCPRRYPTFEVKCKNGTDLTKLYSLNEYQKSFTTCVTFEVELVDTFNVKINYCIPADIALIMDFDLNMFNGEINKAMVGKPADYITTHLIVMQVAMKTFN